MSEDFVNLLRPETAGCDILRWSDINAYYEGRGMHGVSEVWGGDGIVPKPYCSPSAPTLDENKNSVRIETSI